ncbi:MAG: hypothetical protein ACI3T9_01940 [Romboutsia timonensis]
MGRGTLDYFELCDLIAQYYGSDSDEWLEIAKYGIGSDKAASILKQVPYVETTVSESGKILNYSIIKDVSTSATETLPTIIDSNLQTGTASLTNTTQVSIPANTVIDSTGKVIAESGTKAVSTGSKVATVAGKVATGVACVATGLQLGKVIDSALYNANPDFWDSHNMETLNPDTWGDIVTDDNLLGKAFHVFYGLDDNNDTQMYLDENAFAYIASYMQQQGAFASSINIDADSSFTSILNYLKNYRLVGNLSRDKVVIQNSWLSGGHDLHELYVTNSTSPVYGIVFTFPYSGGTYAYAYLLSESTFSCIHKETRSSGYVTSNSVNSEIYGYSSLNGVTVHGAVLYLGREIIDYVYPTESKLYNANNVLVTDVSNILSNTYNLRDFGYMVLKGNKTENSLVTGISNQADATIPTLSNEDTVEQVLQKLKEQLPFLWDDAIENEVIQEDGTTKKYTYVPVGFPDSDKNSTTGNQSQSKTKVGTSSDKKTQDKAVERMSKKKTDPNPPKRNVGSTPIYIVPSGEMDALFTVYNPNLTELKQFGNWLWSSNFFEQLKKLFSDPMQAIIGLHKIYVPTTNLTEKQTIRCGYIDSEVPSYVVANQYTTINCGRVSLLEYFGNVFDYEPYTSIKLYLPFIGIVKLDVSEVMRSTIEIVYHVDVLTGACLAEVKIIRDTTESVLYTFTGNMGVQYPLSSGSYIGIVGGLLGIAGGVVGSLATANPVPLAIGLSAASSSGKLHTDVAHSGNISSNCGAMGIKKPYLIINRPQTQLAEDFEKYQGYPSNYTTTLSNCNGFVQVLEVHVDDIKTATFDEKQSIELLLKQGVIIE